MLQRWQKEERARGKGLHRTRSEGRGALTGASRFMLFLDVAKTAVAPLVVAHERGETVSPRSNLSSRSKLSKASCVAASAELETTTGTGTSPRNAVSGSTRPAGGGRGPASGTRPVSSSLPPTTPRTWAGMGQVPGPPPGAAPAGAAGEETGCAQVAGGGTAGSSVVGRGEGAGPGGWPKNSG